MDKKKKVAKQKVADVEYRCGGNYKCYMVMLLTEESDNIKVGDDIDVSKFGISSEEWFEVILPQWMFGFSYDTSLDHTLVEVLEIREITDDDVCVNTDETGEAKGS